MAATQITGRQVGDGTIQRADLDVATVGNAVIRKAVQGGGITLTSTGADAGTGDVTVALTQIAANSILGNSTSSAAVPAAITAWTNPPWLTSIPWSKITSPPSFEPALGNPSTDGYVLSSTALGVRSWIAPAAGGGVSSFNTRTGAVVPATNDYSFAQINGSAVVAQLPVGSDFAFQTPQTILLSNATTNLSESVLKLRHNSSATPTANFGVALWITGKNSTSLDQDMGQFQCNWSVATAGSDTSYFDFLLRNAGAALASKMRLSGSGGLSVGSTVDPGAGFINANVGFKFANVDKFAGGAIGSGLYKNTATNYDWSWQNMTTTQTTAVATAGTTSTTGVMAGLAASFTPNITGRALVIISGYLTSSVVGSFAAVIGMRYGTGTAPAHGAAATGTAITCSNAYGHSEGAANAAVPFTVVGTVTGLTVGTAYWFDAIYGSSVATSTAKLNTTAVSIIEF